MQVAIVTAVVVYFAGGHEVLFALFASVRCTPSMVAAGENVTCDISTLRIAAQTDLYVVPTGGASELWLARPAEGAGPRWTVGFATSSAGRAGVRVRHTLCTASADVEVVAGRAASAVPMCAPARVTAGSLVRCEVVPRDRHGNVAEVVRPEGAPKGYFSVAPLGTADRISVGDTHVSFTASAVGRAGVAITLNGQREQSDVEVVPGGDQGG